MRGPDIFDRLIGPEGTTVKLTVLRPGQSAPLTFSIVRQRILRFLGVVHEKLNGGAGYIWYRAGPSNDAAEFRRALVELQREGMRGLGPAHTARAHTGRVYDTLGARVADRVATNTLPPSSGLFPL